MSYQIFFFFSCFITICWCKHKKKRCRKNEFCCRLQSGRQQRNEEKTELCQFHHWCLFCHCQGESAGEIGQNAGGCVWIRISIRWFILWELLIDMGHCGTREVQVDGPTLLQEGQRSCGHVWTPSRLSLLQSFKSKFIDDRYDVSALYSFKAAQLWVKGI